MAVPKKKTSKSRRNQRRSHHALGLINIVEDATTGELKLPHHISKDGYYSGRQVVAESGSTDAQAAKKN
jgi:large subunit ribosomal protein L32